MRLDRKIRFRRFVEVDDGFTKSREWTDHGDPEFARKVDISDGERARSNEDAAVITSRFVVRWSGFAADIDPRDRLVCEGLTYDIVGVKEREGRRQWLEITAAARIDQ